MRKFQKPPLLQAAFSLLELVVVVVIVGVLAAIVAPRLSSSEAFAARTAAAEMLSHIRFAQQLSMNNTSALTELTVNEGRVRIFLDGNIRVGYPIDFVEDYSVTPSDAALVFDSRGNTNPTTIIISNDPLLRICVVASGYARIC